MSGAIQAHSGGACAYSQNLSCLADTEVVPANQGENFPIRRGHLPHCGTNDVLLGQSIGGISAGSRRLLLLYLEEPLIPPVTSTLICDYPPGDTQKPRQWCFGYLGEPAPRNSERLRDNIGSNMLGHLPAGVAQYQQVLSLIQDGERRLLSAISLHHVSLGVPPTRGCPEGACFLHQPGQQRELSPGRCPGPVDLRLRGSTPRQPSTPARSRTKLSASKASDHEIEYVSGRSGSHLRTRSHDPPSWWAYPPRCERPCRRRELIIGRFLDRRSHQARSTGAPEVGNGTLKAWGRCRRARRGCGRWVRAGIRPVAVPTRRAWVGCRRLGHPVPSRWARWVLGWRGC